MRRASGHSAGRAFASARSAFVPVEWVQMSQTAYRKQIFNGLVESLKHCGVGKIEINVHESDERIEVEKLTKPTARCEVWLLRDEPVFYCNFDSGGPSMSGITFTVSERDTLFTSNPATRVFSSADQAAQWLLIGISITP